MFDLGYVSAIQPDLSFENLIVFAAAHGFKCVEVMCWPSQNEDTRRYAGVSHIDVDHLSPIEINRIHSILEKYNIYISALGYYPNPLDTDQGEYFRGHIKKVIKASALLGINKMNTFVGKVPHLPLKDNFQLFEKFWPEIVAFAEELNVKIGIENCPMYFTQDEWPGGKNLATTPAIWTKMFDIIKSDALGLNYDPSHMVWQKMDEISPIYDFEHKLFHIHLKDVKVYKDKLDKVGIMAHPLEYHSPKLPGLGDVRWGPFFGALTDVKYKGPVCIEVEDKAFEGSSDDVTKAILTARNYVSQFFG